MICNLCRCTASLRRDGNYASHEDGTDTYCSAVGRNPDEATAMRYTFKDKGQSPTQLLLADDGNGILVYARSDHSSASAAIWTGLSKADARRMIDVLVELVNAVEAREG